MSNVEMSLCRCVRVVCLASSLDFAILLLCLSVILIVGWDVSCLDFAILSPQPVPADQRDRVERHRIGEQPGVQLGDRIWKSFFLQQPTKD